MDTTGNADFAAVSAVCSLLSGLTVPSWIIGGWAIDLAVGRVTRDHADVDVMLLERDKHVLWDDLPEDDVQITGRGRESRRLTLHSENLLLPAEVFLAEADGTCWVHRRGTYRVKRPLADITRHRDGIPFLAPEVVLLFKARSKADKDQHDVETALPLLDAGQRSWLQETLKRLPQGRAAAVPRR
jgi:Aminoglycoside-2''-adenylyltransferase